MTTPPQCTTFHCTLCDALLNQLHHADCERHQAVDPPANLVILDQCYSYTKRLFTIVPGRNQ